MSEVGAVGTIGLLDPATRASPLISSVAARCSTPVARRPTMEPQGRKGRKVDVRRLLEATPRRSHHLDANPLRSLRPCGSPQVAGPLPLVVVRRSHLASHHPSLVVRRSAARVLLFRESVEYPMNVAVTPIARCCLTTGRCAAAAQTLAEVHLVQWERTEPSACSAMLPHSVLHSSSTSRTYGPSK